MNCMTNNIVAIQGNHPSKLNPITDTSIFLANEIQSKNYRIFYYDPKNLSIINSKVIAEGFFIKFTYKQKKFFKILKDFLLRKINCAYFQYNISWCWYIYCIFFNTSYRCCCFSSNEHYRSIFLL